MAGTSGTGVIQPSRVSKQRIGEAYPVEIGQLHARDVDHQRTKRQARGRIHVWSMITKAKA